MVAGKAYVAAHVDAHKNLCPRYVKRPEILSVYFAYNDVIDNINSGAQRTWH